MYQNVEMYAFFQKKNLYIYIFFLFIYYNLLIIIYISTLYTFLYYNIGKSYKKYF